MKLVFIVSAILLATPYLIYPAVIYLWSVIRPKPIRKGEVEPKVTLLISAYNEAKHIAEKLDNSLELDYPPDKLEVAVVADGSSDGTKEIVEGYADKGVRLFWSPERKGKLKSILDVWPRLMGEVVVFSDANNIYNREAVRAITSNFADERVGAVCGEKKIVDSVNSGTPVSAGESAYWRFEGFVKQRESMIGSICGAMGEIYAVRREVINPHSLEAAIDDSLYISLKAVLSGKRLVWEPDAKSFEKASVSFTDEFRRKSRIVAAALQTIGKIPQILLPTKSPIWLQMTMHKVLKWFAAVFMIAAFVSAWFLPSGAFKYAAVGSQLAFYGLAAVNLIPPIARRRIKVFYLPFYFCLGNLAALWGLVRWLFGWQPYLWEKVER